MNTETFIYKIVTSAITALYGEVNPAQVQIQKTRKEFEGRLHIGYIPIAQDEPQISRGYRQRDWRVYRGKQWAD